MDRAMLTGIIADTLGVAIAQAHRPIIANVEIADAERGVILFDTVDGGSFSLTIENINT